MLFDLGWGGEAEAFGGLRLKASALKAVCKLTSMNHDA